MDNKFKYEIWNLSDYIVSQENKPENNLAGKELEKISGGSVARNISAGFLMGVSVLTAVPIFNETNVSAAVPSVSVDSQIETKNQNVNFEITKEQAIEDINYVLKIIKDNHASAVEKLSDEVTNQAKTEIENLENKISVIDEWRTISRILAKLNDAHTRVLPPKFLNNRLPFDTEYDCGKFICKSGNFKGCEITAINDISTSELYQTFQNHYSYEIEEWTEHNFFETPSDFIPESRLALCGIDTFKPIKVSFKTKSGIQSQNFEVSKIEKPNRESEHWVSYEIDEEHSIGIFKLIDCKINDEYVQTLLKFLKELSAKKIKNIAIDLRKNVGGDSTVAVLFAMALKNLAEFRRPAMDIRNGDTLQRRHARIMNRDDIEQYRTDYLGKDYDKNLLFGGKVFLLTSHRVFSSAILFAEFFQDNHLATIVGEIPGNSPEHFGNRVLGRDAQGNVSPIDFKTPNSNLTFRTTFKKFYRVDETKDGTKLIPDVEVPAKDALNKVYEIIDEENNYSSFETEHFDVIYPKDEKEKCERALNELEKNYGRVTNDLKVKVDKKTKIKLFKTKDNFHKSEGCYGFPEYTSWLNGTANDGFIKTHLELTPERIEEILAHEFTHIAVDQINKSHIPFVFNEGIATYEAGQSHLKDKLKLVNELPFEPDWLIKGQFPQNMAYCFAYSFVEFIVKNYGYDKMIEFLEVDYQNNKFDFESVKDIYSKWKNEILSG